ncbi:unnamed protein product [Urochloa humidicola]
MDAAAAAAVPALPEDAVSEILARVPDVVSLFRCAAVCKPWRRLLADPVFLRRCRILWPAPRGGASSLLGFFVQRHQLSVNAQRKVSKLFPSRSPVLVPSPGSALGPGRRFLTSFVCDDVGVLDNAKPLAARGGLLLLRLALRSEDKITVLRLCVCDLLASKRDLLPPLDVAGLDSEGVRGCAILTAADHGTGTHRPANGYSTFFEVLLTGVRLEDGRGQVVMYEFSPAASASWSSSLIQGSLAGPPFGNRVAAVTGGIARWLSHSHSANPNGNGPSLCTIDVGISTGSVSATKLPLDMLPRAMRVDRTNVWLCLAAKERLSLVYLQHNKLWILIQKDGGPGGAGTWLCTPVLTLDVEPGLHGIESLSMVSVGEKSRTVLALYYSDPNKAYVLDLQSGSVTKLAGWKRSFNYMTAVAYEINWLEFFMSRLAVCQ